MTKLGTLRGFRNAGHENAARAVFVVAADDGSGRRRATKKFERMYKWADVGGASRRAVEGVPGSGRRPYPRGAAGVGVVPAADAKFATLPASAPRREATPGRAVGLVDTPKRPPSPRGAGARAIGLQ